MHFYKIPDGSENEAELVKLRDIADQFNAAAQKACMSDPAVTEKFVKEISSGDEGPTLQGMSALIQSPDARGNSVELLIGLQMIDITADLVGRVDKALAKSCVPAEMVKPEIADLFKKYDLPVLEKLSRKVIKPPTL